MKLRNRIIHSDTDLLILEQDIQKQKLAQNTQKLSKLMTSIRPSKSDGNLYIREYDEQTKNRVYDLQRMIHGSPIIQKYQ